MAGETEEKPSGWTVDTLHALVRLWMSEKDRRDEDLRHEKDRRDEQRFEAQQLALRDALIAQEKAVNAALQAAQQAVTKAEIAAEKRFDNVNEFRGQLADQAANLMPRNEATVLFKSLDERVNKLESGRDIVSGRSRGLADGWGYIVGAIGAIAAVVAIILAFNN